MDDAAQIAPSAARNREPILAVLRAWLPITGLVLEVASGTGEHAVWFSARLPGVTWQPTDVDPARVASIAAWRAAEGMANLLAPMMLDAAAPVWPVAAADALVAVNVTHIAPWAVTVGLFAGAARVLRRGGIAILYGPLDDGEMGDGNVAFDADLRARDPAWGVRRSADVVLAAQAAGLALATEVAMPANNTVLVFRAPPS